MATHSSVLAWRIPGTEEPCGLPSMGSHRVGHVWSDLAAAAARSTVIICLHCLLSHREALEDRASYIFESPASKTRF